jgi:hypothetical protein
MAWMRTSLYIASAVIVLWMIGAQAAGIFQCWPIEKFWNPQMSGHCINGSIYFKAITGINLVTDVILLCLPVPLLWGLQASLKRRISLIIGFTMGGFVTLITIARIHSLNNPHDPDTLYSATEGPIWTAAETSLGVVCASLPVIYLLLKPTIEKTTSQRSKTRGSTKVADWPQPTRPSASGWEAIAEDGTIRQSVRDVHDGEFVELVDQNRLRNVDAVLLPDKTYQTVQYDVDYQESAGTHREEASEDGSTKGLRFGK